MHPTIELHPVVELFLRRAASNPEEMSNGRWRWVLERIQMHGSQSEKDAVQPVYNKLRLDGAHKEMMEALLNPEPVQQGMFSPSDYAQKTQHQSTPQYQSDLQKVLGKIK